VNGTLRRVHRLAIPVLVIAGPTALALAIAVRSPIPSMALPPSIAPAKASDADDGGENGPGFGIRHTSAGLVVALARPLSVPDPLVYWTPKPPEGTALPDGAVLLGPLSADAIQVLPSPPEGGTIVLYSLGHAEVVAAVSAP
jgi:hypothetical protein